MYTLRGAAGRLTRFGGLLAILLPLFAWGCVSPIEPAKSVVWEGTLQPAGSTPIIIGGSVGMLAHSQSTQIGIGIEGSEPGLVLRWELRFGNCSAAGETVAEPTAFPLIELGPSGGGTSQVVLNGRVDTALSYALWVRMATGSQGEVACGQLVRRD